MMIQTARTMILLTLLAALPAHAGAGEPADPGFTCTPPQRIGLIEGLRNPRALTIDGDYAYLMYQAKNDDHLAIIDLADHSNPKILSSTEISSNFSEATPIIHGDALYLHNGGNTLIIYNIEDKADPWFVRSYEASFFDQIAVTAETIYQRFESSALNVSRPLAPGLDRLTDTNFEFSTAPISVLDNELITASLDRYTIDDPLNPILISQNTEPTPRLDQYRYEEPYILNLNNFGGNELGVISQNPTTNELQRLDMSAGFFLDSTVRADLIFSINESEGINIDTLTDTPSRVATIASQDIVGNAMLIRQHRDHIIIAADEAFAIYNIPTNPVAGARTDLAQSHLELMGDTAVLSTGSIDASTQGASVIDITDPARPRWITDLPTPDAFGIDSIAPYAFIADKNAGLKAFDLTDPTNPVLSATYNTSANQSGTPNTRDIFITATHAYAADRNAGLTIYEIVNGHELHPISTLPIPQAIQRIRVEGDLAYASAINALYLIDISNPAAPFILSTIDELPATENYIHSASRQGDLLYTADSNNGYRIFDISNRADPLQLAHFDAIVNTTQGEFEPFVYEVIPDQDRLYIAMSFGGFAIYDNTDPFNPTLIRHAPASSPPSNTTARYRDLEIRDNLLYTAAGNAGMRIYDLNDCAGPCIADLNTDGTLNFFDVAEFIAAFTSEDPLADLESDGVFNFFDVAAFIGAYNSGCP